MSMPDDWDDETAWHGHIRPNSKGIRARCGILHMCSRCIEEKAILDKLNAGITENSIAGITPVAAGSTVKPAKPTLLRQPFPATGVAGSSMVPTSLLDDALIDYGED